ncbi:MAG TPA: hypothetical protein VGM19_06805 [Armatimonadota bacterium]|jgi:hypothetical protein
MSGLTTSNVVVLLWVGLVVGWLAAYLSALPDRLPLTQNPLALLALAWRRLWGKNRSLLGWIVVISLVQRPAEFLLSWLGRPDGGPVLRQLADTWWRFPWAEMGSDLPRRVRQSLETPYFLPQSLPNWGVVLNSQFLLPVALGLGLVWIAVRRPSWLAPGLRRGSLPLAGLLLSAATLRLALSTWMPEVRGKTPTPSELRLEHLLPFAAFLMLLAATPVVVFAWSLVWQVARGARWSLREAVRDTLRYWWAGCLLYASIYLLQLLPTSAQRLVGPVYDGWRVVVAVFFLLPWLLLSEGRGLGWSLRQALTLWRTNSRDLLLFALRYVVLASPLLLGLWVFRIGNSFLLASDLVTAVKQVVNLLLLLTCAIFYVELRKRQREGEASIVEQANGPTPLPPP